MGVIALAALTGCSDKEPGKYPDLTLSETKSPAQLLRNEAAARVPADAILNVENTKDGSEACQSKEQDPDGLIRSWRSTVLINVTGYRSPEVGAITDELVASFVADGWTSSTSGSSTKVHTALLKSETSLAKVHVTTTEDADGDGVGARILIATNGPCVVTAGPESDEVLKLEAAE